jgi:sRNA-binding protein
MSYRPYREETEAAIKLLAERYPRCFFEEPKLRRPLKQNIIADLEKDGAPMARELIVSAIEWYESNFAAKYAVQAGAKRVDLTGKEVATVTELEEKNAKKYIHERKQEREERERLAQPEKTQLKEIPMMRAAKPMKPTKPIDPVSSIQDLLDAVRAALLDQPEALRRPFAVAGLRVIITECEKTITSINDEGAERTS